MKDKEESGFLMTIEEAAAALHPSVPTAAVKRAAQSSDLLITIRKQHYIERTN